MSKNSGKNLPKNIGEPKILTIPELLAPAGSPACALAAFDAGADAVYAGLSKFNARERGENFTPDSMGRIIRYAHKNGRKVYITLNTLIKENELPQVAETLALLSDLGPDAILVQDLGVLRMAREYFPNLEIHASTQMGFHNSAGLKVAEKLGVKRVVLERQVTLEELQLIKNSTNLELEVFIHGALCCSLSGACLFSSWLGGHSGNRGKCKQPCRRRYFSNNGNGFFFSPQDLCTAELIPQFKKMGVASLKIEGRLRQPDYVTSAVSAYRMLLDAPEKEFSERLGEARALLSRTCGRKWSFGFYTKESNAQLIREDSIGAAGLRCGTVEDVQNWGFGFTAKARVGMGDKIRVQPPNGDDGVAFTITKLFVNNQEARRARSGERVFVCCDKAIPFGGTVFKIGESSGDYTKRIDALPPVRKKVDLSVSLSGTQIEINATNAFIAPYKEDLQLSLASRHPVDVENLKQAFAASDSEDFELGAFNANISGEWFFPAAELKNIRRNFWNYFKDNVLPQQMIGNTGVALEKFRKDYMEMQPNYSLGEGHLPETALLKPNGTEPAMRQTIRSNSVFELNKLSKEATIPAFMPEEKLPSLKKAIEKARSEFGIKRFRITSLYALAYLKPEKGDFITASFPLPVCNSMAIKELESFGVDRACAHIELEKTALEALLAKSVMPLELYRLGRPALLTTRTPIPVSGKIKDGRGQEFEVRYTPQDNLYRLFALSVFSLPRMPGFLAFYDLQNTGWNSAEKSTFNFENELS